MECGFVPLCFKRLLLIGFTLNSKRVPEKNLCNSRIQYYSMTPRSLGIIFSIDFLSVFPRSQVFP